MKAELYKWANAVLQHIRCFINDNSIMMYRTNILHRAKEDLENKDNTHQMDQKMDLMKDLYNNMVHKMFNARSKESLHPFLERNCGRHGKQNTMVMRNTLKAISGLNHDKKTCLPEGLDPEISADHKSIERLARWLGELSEYHPRFKWIPRTTNELADGLSRRVD